MSAKASEGAKPMETMEQLRSACQDCAKCELGKTRTNLVFGVGNEHADLMFVGEGPGEQEDLQGLPFVGRAGKLLDDMLAMFDLKREDVYIANIVKCRPPRNRDPLPDEQDACYPWLAQQLALVKPKLVVCLGRIAAMRLIDPHYRITQQHGQWVSRDGMEITAIYHPAALLRDPRRRPEAFDDMKEIAARLKALN
jgi:DNA polymerase